MNTTRRGPRARAFSRSFLGVAAWSAMVTAFAQTPPAPVPAASAWIIGHMSYRGKNKGQHYTLNANVVVPGNPSNPGASAAFAVDDDGKVTAVGQTAYQPTQGLSTVRREFDTPKPPMTGEQGPRYLMVCSWPLDDQRHAAGPVSIGFAERDDTRTKVSKDGTLQESLTMHWVGIPAPRAQAKFAAKDYCGEVARTGKSSAPMWMLPGKS
ncbi:hypothetical protein [Variovorax rhizosphaerae]|uniref:DUF3455 domain-containing protein n=1 Tax=Variovorax rhizosphaerae TaxID=1836200 RepID=A0ABU8WJH9_9BURK